MPRAAIYIRISPQEADQPGREKLSLSVQESRCRAAAIEDGYASDDLEVFRDDRRTSRNLSRPAMQLLLSRLAEFDAIYAVDQSRVSSSVRDLEDLRLQLIAAGVDLLVLDGSVELGTPAGTFMSRIDAASREYRMDVQIARSIDSLRQLAERGHHHGRCPFGYRRPRDAGGHIIRDAPLEVEPAEAEVVRRIFRAIASGRSLAAVCRELTSAGVRGRMGSTQWRGRGVRLIVRNPVHRGRVAYGGEEFQADHEPLVSDALWHAAQVALQARSHRRGGAGSTLSPLLTCGVCGGVVSCCGGRTYRCADRLLRPTRDRHVPVDKAAACVEATLWAWVEALFGSDVLVRAAERASGDAGEPVDVGAEVAALDEQIAWNVEVGRGGGMPAGMVVDLNRELMARRRELLARVPVGEGLDGRSMRWLREHSAYTVDWLRSREPSQAVHYLSRVFSSVKLYRDGMVFEHLLEIPARGVAYPEYEDWRHCWGPVDLTPWSPSDPPF